MGLLIRIQHGQEKSCLGAQGKRLEGPLTSLNLPPTPPRPSLNPGFRSPDLVHTLPAGSAGVGAAPGSAVAPSDLTLMAAGSSWQEEEKCGTGGSVPLPLPLAQALSFLLLP